MGRRTKGTDPRERSEHRMRDSLGTESPARFSDYRPSLSAHARQLCELGLSDSEIARVLEVSPVAFDRLRLDHPEFKDALCRDPKKAVELCEAALLRLATGYDVEEIKATIYRGKVTYVRTIKHIPPNLHALEFVLLNRNPVKWRTPHKIENVPAPDPEAEKRRQHLIKVLSEIIEERARKGLPPLFPENEALVRDARGDPSENDSAVTREVNSIDQKPLKRSPAQTSGSPPPHTPAKPPLQRTPNARCNFDNRDPPPPTHWEG